MDHGPAERRRRVLIVNASGECSGAEAVILDHIELAITDGIEVVVACPPGPLVTRLPEAVRHVALPTFGLGAEGRAARVLAGAQLVVRTVRTARILRARGACDRRAHRGQLAPGPSRPSAWPDPPSRGPGWCTTS